MLNDTDVRAAVRDWTAPVPSDPEALFATIWEELGSTVVNSPNAMLVVTLRAGQYMCWEVRGPLPGSVDDLVRCMVDYSSASAVVVVHPLPIPLDSAAHDALSFTCEVGGARIPYIVTVYNGPAGLSYEVGRVPDPDVAPRWVGVPPGGEVVLWEMGPEMQLGPTAEA